MNPASSMSSMFKVMRVDSLNKKACLTAGRKVQDEKGILRLCGNYAYGSGGGQGDGTIFFREIR